MMNRQHIATLAMAAMAAASCVTETPEWMTCAGIARAMESANDHWQSTHPDSGNAFWDNAVYHTGNIEACLVRPDTAWLGYSTRWAERNRWMGATCPDTALWQYRPYGEAPEFVLFGDWQVCFQTYLDLALMRPDSIRTARAFEVMQHEIATPRTDYWWWADALYMVMPVMSKMYIHTGNELYISKMCQYMAHTDSVMYDADACLYYRDAKYVYPQHATASGTKDFWARGDGWVMAALAKVLADIPDDSPHRPRLLERFRAMASAVAACQQPQGHWTRSMLDPDHAPGFETSGTALFTFALFRGINRGWIPRDRYLLVAVRGWDYLCHTALQPDGRVGYVQPIGERAIPGQTVDAQSTANFGVGAFLLAAAEAYRYAASEDQPQSSENQN